jgi:polyribonucleotide nucleotidyltransferase
MAKVLPWARGELSPHAPRVSTVKIARNRIGELIGPGGKNIRGLQEETGTEVEVNDAGLVRIYAGSPQALEQARARVLDLTGVPELGKEYQGRVVAVKHFGSFVRLFAGVEGLLAGVELSEGATVPVRVSGVNPEGKLVLERVREGR